MPLSGAVHEPRPIGRICTRKRIEGFNHLGDDVTAILIGGNSGVIRRSVQEPVGLPEPSPNHKRGGSPLQAASRSGQQIALQVDEGVFMQLRGHRNDDRVS